MFSTSIEIFQGEVLVKVRSDQGFLHELVPQGMAQFGTNKVGELHEAWNPGHILKAC